MDWVRRRQVSPLLQNYWHWLMYFNNAAAIKDEAGLFAWPVAFNVPNTTMMPLLGLKDRRALQRQRCYLIKLNRVTYQKGVTGRAGTYSLMPFDRGLRSKVVRDKAGDGVTEVWTQGDPLADPKGSQYINVNYKYTSLPGYIQDAAPETTGFNLLPQLTDEERAAIEAKYPQDKVARFQAMWEARERKQAMAR